MEFKVNTNKQEKKQVELNATQKSEVVTLIDYFDDNNCKYSRNTKKDS